jgi:hypothetical protein
MNYLNRKNENIKGAVFFKFDFYYKIRKIFRYFVPINLRIYG